MRLIGLWFGIREDYYALHTSNAMTFWGMKMTSKIDSTFQFNQTALSLRAARQEIIASNIANADTPNYKAKDINFASALQGAMTGKQVNLPLMTSAPAHFGSPTGESVFGEPVLYRGVVQPSADGNTVDMDVERAQFADNALRYEASVSFVSGKVKDVLAALQG
jgi:flagellar basal-body rod protein FlgB